MRDWTPFIIVAIPLGLGMIDVYLYYVGGNEATISAVMLEIRASRPLVALALAWSIGVFLGHLFFPVFTAQGPPTSEVIARMFVVLSPTIYALIIIGAGNGTNEAHTRALETGGQLPLAGYMSIALHLGGLAGKFGLPQHLSPLVAA